jgi:hypothetical protein
MGGPCNQNKGRWSAFEILTANILERDLQEGPGVYERTILELALKK